MMQNVLLSFRSHPRILVSSYPPPCSEGQDNEVAMFWEISRSPRATKMKKGFPRIPHHHCRSIHWQTEQDSRKMGIHVVIGKKTCYTLPPLYDKSKLLPWVVAQNLRPLLSTCDTSFGLVIIVRYGERSELKPFATSEATGTSKNQLDAQSSPPERPPSPYRRCGVTRG